MCTCNILWHPRSVPCRVILGESSDLVKNWGCSHPVLVCSKCDPISTLPERTARTQSLRGRTPARGFAMQLGVPTRHDTNGVAKQPGVPPIQTKWLLLCNRLEFTGSTIQADKWVLLCNMKHCTLGSRMGLDMQYGVRSRQTYLHTPHIKLYLNLWRALKGPTLAPAPQRPLLSLACSN